MARKDFDGAAVVAAVSPARANAAVEQALVDALAGRGPLQIAYASGGALSDLAAAAAAAVAAKFLAVGTPRSLGLIGAGPMASAMLAAHRVLFAPTDVRIADSDGARATALAAELGARATTVAEAAAADIVCITAAIPVERAWLRSGTHVSALGPGTAAITAATLRAELVVAGLARDRGESARMAELGVKAQAYGSLAEIAAGKKDGRQLDELSVFFALDLQLAELAIVLAAAASA